MSQYDNTNSGALFQNDRKTKDTQPGWRGTVNVDGKEYWVSGWVNQVKGGTRKGQKFISVKLDPKEDQQNTGGYGDQPSNTDDDYDDDIPF